LANDVGVGAIARQLPVAGANAAPSASGRSAGCRQRAFGGQSDREPPTTTTSSPVHAATAPVRGASGGSGSRVQVPGGRSAAGARRAAAAHQDGRGEDGDTERSHRLFDAPATRSGSRHV
jgi:hypothetical protein